MPKLNDNLETFKTVGSYGFSATGLDKLLSTEYTLTTIIVDSSGSTDPFHKDMKRHF